MGDLITDTSRSTGNVLVKTEPVEQPARSVTVAPYAAAQVRSHDGLSGFGVGIKVTAEGQITVYNQDEETVLPQFGNTEDVRNLRDALNILLGEEV